MNNEIALIDGLFLTELEIRKARQILQEFYDDIAVSEARYPKIQDLLDHKAPNDIFDTQIFKIINEYPRICNLLMVLYDVMANAQSTAIECLKRVGQWECDTAYIV